MKKMSLDAPDTEKLKVTKKKLNSTVISEYVEEKVESVKSRKK